MARRLARQGSVGQDPFEIEKAWSAVAFQAQGLADELSAKEAYELLRSLSAGGVLTKYEGACSALLGTLRKRGEGQLKPRKVINIWAALDRADAQASEVDAFFLRELPRALPGSASSSASSGVPGAHEASDGGGGDDDEKGEGIGEQPAAAGRSGPRGTGKDWRRTLALLEASGCPQLELREVWVGIEVATLADSAAVKSLSINGLVAALRSAALASGRAGTPPSPELVQRLCRRATAQARWLDGWAASHIALASASLGALPREGYDPLRQALLDRCALGPSKPGSKVGGKQFAKAPGRLELHGLAEAERVAAALAGFDVHDAEVRDRIAAWLSVPLPPKRFANLARDLAAIGLSDSSSSHLARHVRARLRSSELRAEVGAEELQALARSYARPGEDEEDGS